MQRVFRVSYVPARKSKTLSCYQSLRWHFVRKTSVQHRPTQTGGGCNKTVTPLCDSPPANSPSSVPNQVDNSMLKRKAAPSAALIAAPIAGLLCHPLMAAPATDADSPAASATADSTADGGNNTSGNNALEEV